MASASAFKVGDNLSDSQPTTRTSALVPKVLQLLEDLQKSPSGAAIYRHAREILDAHEEEAAGVTDLYRRLLQAVLAAYARRLPDQTAQQAEIRMLQLRLSQPLTHAELTMLAPHFETLAGEEAPPAGEEAPPAGEEAPEPAETPAPLFTRRGADTADAAGAEAHHREEPRPHFEPEPGQKEETPAAAEGGDRRVDVTYRKHLNEKRERIQKIQETLARQVAEVIKQNEKFGILLEVEHETLRQTEDIRELETLKQALINEVATLRDGHQTLAKKLETASKYLQIIESEGQHLNDELTRVHILSLTDELTELPNRRAFMRRLEDEVARVQRYGYPLSLGLIDMDGFKAINDQYGHAAGDEVLRNFSSNVLSIFRHHDMVARYGGEEFAVLLPNTDNNGAQRALEKVKKRASECPYQFEGRTMPMPTFSAGIALYRPGETPGDFIERADKALYRAKRLGRNRIEQAQHDSSDATLR